MEDPLGSRPRNAIASFAWANLVLYWAHRWAPTDVNAYFLDDSGLVVARLVALLGLVAVLTLVLFAAIELAHRRGIRAHRALALGLGGSLVLPVGALTKELVRSWPPLEAMLGAVFAIGGLAMLVGLGWLVRSAHRDPRKAAGTVLGVLVLAAPFGGLVNAETAYAAYDLASRDLAGDRTAELRPANAETSPVEAPVLVLVFDALDRRTAFDDRPADVALPAFDRLAEEAVVAEEATAPAGWTMHSIPAMLTGLPVERAEPSGPDDLELELADGSQTRLSEETTLFDHVRDAGGTSEVVGFYHPYCRLVHADACEWYPHGRIATKDLSPGSLLLDQGLTAIGGLPDTLINPLGMIEQTREALGTDRTTAHAHNYEQITQQTIHALEPPRHDLVYVHLNIPHRPAIHAADTGKTGAVEGASYRGNLVLADDILAQIRAELEAHDAWEDTAIVLTSDHGDREASAVADGSASARQVPLIVKPPEPSPTPTVEGPLDNRVLPDLTRALLEGELGTGDEIAAFLAEEAPEPYPSDA